ncbi:MAG: AsmA-like C-terminal region-containing protein, partial [Alphaproteobacteria bacterium]|nr:AsmA-like C-terminal region-containing protein [Alphaproteobacteria bacterium]
DIEDGILEARVIYKQDAENNTAMVGTAHMYNFKAVKTPVITKLILLSPFGMIKKSLQGSSLIPFQHMEIPFTFQNNKISIKNSYAIGKVLSLGLEGSVDRKTSLINIKGKVIPKTKFNTVLAKMKGKNASTTEKQGFISTNFSVKGTIEEPSVNMNPVSAAISFLLRLSPIGLV